MMQTHLPTLQKLNIIPPYRAAILVLATTFQCKLVRLSDLIASLRRSVDAAVVIGFIVSLEEGTWMTSERTE